jgi:hypothetical protein
MLKYNSKDTEKMIDVFAALAEKRDNPAEIGNEIVKLLDYPVPVLQEFLKCMDVLEKHDENYLKENYMGVIGYITLRINLVKA